MNYKLQPIEEDEFKRKINIHFNNINHGLDKYSNYSLKCINEDSNEEKFINFIEKAFQLNGEENSYVDFYLSRLNEEEKNNLMMLLEVEDKAILKKLIDQPIYNTIYYRLNFEMIPFLTRLCTREVLFCSFYFTKFPCTIWGNYNMKFPIFFDDEVNACEYKNIAENCEMQMIFAE